MKRLILLFVSVILFAPVTKAQQSNDGEFKTRNQTTKSEKSRKNDDDGEKAFGKGKLVIVAGYGFPNLYKSFFKNTISNSGSSTSGYSYDYTVKGFGPVFLRGEYGITKWFGAGLIIGYSQMSVTKTDAYTEEDYDSNSGTYVTGTYQDVAKYTHTSLSIGARANFHFGTGKRIDPYAGVGLGYSSNQNKFTYSTTNPYQALPVPVSISGIPFYFAISIGTRYYFTDNIGLYAEFGFDKWSLLQGGLAFKL
jgi:opacity protein-like surface antigen